MRLQRALWLWKSHYGSRYGYEVRGFLGQEVAAAFLEVQAIAKGTQCAQSFFSVSLTPPREADVKTSMFEEAVDRAEAVKG